MIDWKGEGNSLTHLTFCFLFFDLYKILEMLLMKEYKVQGVQLIWPKISTIEWGPNELHAWHAKLSLSALKYIYKLV